MLGAIIILLFPSDRKSIFRIETWIYGPEVNKQKCNKLLFMHFYWYISANPFSQLHCYWWTLECMNSEYSRCTSLHTKDGIRVSVCVCVFVLWNLLGIYLNINYCIQIAINFDCLTDSIKRYVLSVESIRKWIYCKTVHSQLYLQFIRDEGRF